MKDIIKKNPILTAFKLAFGGMFGVMAAEALVFLFTLICIIIGVSIIVYFSTDKEKEDIKKEEKINMIKTIKQFTLMQYLGLIIIVIGLLPWGQWLMIGLMEGAGITLFDDLFN